MSRLLGPSTDTGPHEEPQQEQSYCLTKWNEAVQACRQNLSSQDQGQLDMFNTWDDLLRYLSNMEQCAFPTSDITLIQRIRPSLVPLRSFITLLAASLGSGVVQTAVIWGIITLAIEAAARTESLLPNTLEMLDDLGNDLEIFQIYESTFAQDKQMENALMDIFVDIITFWTKAIQFLRRNKHSVTSKTAWPRVYKEFEDTSKRIRKRSQQLKEKAKALTSARPNTFADLLAELDRFGMIPGQNVPAPSISNVQSIFPCDNIPFARNANFVHRDKELETINDCLDLETTSQTFRSFALYGTGGIGKTQTALHFAHKQREKGVAAILWLDCETGLSLGRSFQQVAEMLQLEGYSQDENSDQNKILVLKWLRRTTEPWLMIMDNVEDLELARNAWPSAPRGGVLVTSRNSIVSIDPAAGGLEIEIFEEEQGSELLLKMIARDEYSDEERAAAKQLSARLGGLALALAVMGSQIRLREKSIAEFLNMYTKYAARLNKERRGIETYYKFSIESCWKTTFDYLDEHAFKIMEVISVVAPDNIPLTLFKQKDLPASLEFCKDDWDLDNALDQLISTSLVRRNPSTNMLYIHRLTQEAFREHIGVDKRRQCFNIASKLLNGVFPKLVNGLSLRPFWFDCKRYIAHVLILCARYEEDKFQSTDPQEFLDFLELSTSCGWYLMECGAWSENIELMKTAMPMVPDQEGLIWANLANSLGHMETERAHFEAAGKYMQKSYDIRRRLLPPTHEEVANGLNNLGCVILQRLLPGDIEKSIEMFYECIQINKQLPKAHTERFLHVPHNNISKALRVLREYDGCIEYARKSQAYANAFLGPGNHFHGLAEYYIGNAEFDQGHFDEAEEHWELAMKFFMQENETHPTIVAVKLKLNCVYMKRGQYEKAIAGLKAVLTLAQLGERAKGDQGETARVKRKLAEAYELNKDWAIANRLKEEAEAVRKEFQGDRFDEFGDNDFSYASMSFHTYW